MPDPCSLANIRILVQSIANSIEPIEEKNKFSDGGISDFLFTASHPSPIFNGIGKRSPSMLGGGFDQKKKLNVGISGNGAARKRNAQPPIGDISKMLNPSGRIGLQTLQKLANVYNREQFMKFMQQPVLVGSSIQAGSIFSQSRLGHGEMNRTVIFELDGSEDESSPSESLQHAIYPLVKSEYATGARNTFSIGRVDGNDMIMPDFAISKQHAILEIKRGSYLIRDCDSTNGTMVCGKRLEKKSVKINDGDIVAFARYKFTFIFPESLYVMLRGPRS